MIGRLRDVARELGAGALELLLPVVCAACQRSLDSREPATHFLAGVLCRGCARQLVRLAAGGCSRCQQPVLAGATRCQACAGKRSAVESTTAAVSFEGAVEGWIQAFKYPRRGLAGLAAGPEAIARALVQEAGRICHAPLPDCIVPVPAHPRRLRERGFNPAGLLARPLARELRVPCHTHLLVRIRDTPSQTRLDRRARRSNLRGAFRCGDLPARIVWLVDDVRTTGSTLEEAARTLRGAGAAQVHAICAAWTPAIGTAGAEIGPLGRGRVHP